MATRKAASTKKATAKKPAAAKASKTTVRTVSASAPKKKAPAVNTEPVVTVAKREKTTTLPKNIINVIFAELVGTFILTLVALTSFNDGSIGAIAIGFALSIIVMTVGAVSGAHVNPAVTLGLWSVRKLKPILLPFYWGSQFLGAMLAISSTTIIIKALDELGLKHERFAQLIFGILIVEDILATCAGKAYEDVRDAALLQLLLTGVRRAELAQLWVEDIDLGNRLARVGAFKSARVNAAVVRVVDGQEHHAGRYVPLTPEAVLAVTRWLKVRAGHKLVERGDSGPMWYGTRGRSKLTGNGILRMVKRRAEEAGYNPAQINVHAFRHTWADRMLDSGKLHEGEVMALGGCKDRSMLDRYASNRANARAIDAARRVGLA